MQKLKQTANTKCCSDAHNFIEHAATDERLARYRERPSDGSDKKIDWNAYFAGPDTPTPNLGRLIREKSLPPDVQLPSLEDRPPTKPSRRLREVQIL